MRNSKKITRTISLVLTGLSALWLGVGSGGCGGDGSGAGGSGGGTGATTGSGTTAAEACDAFAAAACGKLDACVPLLIELVFGDVATCATRDAISCVAYFGVPGVTATPDEFVACADAYAASSCTDLSNGEVPASCEGPSHGTLADGTACAFSVQCVSGRCDLGGDANGCGVCAHVAAVGESCAVDPGACGGASFCSAKTSLCTAASATKGTACDDEVRCLAPYWCSAGMCAEQGGDGAPCDIQEPSCDGTKGLFCNSMAKTCAKITLAAPGEACGFDQATGDITSCKAQGECAIGMGGKGICKAPIADGAACTADPNEPDRCTSPARCVDGICSLVTPTCQ